MNRNLVRYEASVQSQPRRSLLDTAIDASLVAIHRVDPDNASLLPVLPEPFDTYPGADYSMFVGIRSRWREIEWLTFCHGSAVALVLALAQKTAEAQ